MRHWITSFRLLTTLSMLKRFAKFESGNSTDELTTPLRRFSRSGHPRCVIRVRQRRNLTKKGGLRTPFLARLGRFRGFPSELRAAALRDPVGAFAFSRALG